MIRSTIVNNRVFLLSPASASGKRAQLLLNKRAEFALAHKLRDGKATLGEVFAFLSGLYFSGKLAYAEHFALPPPHVARALVITAGKGVLPSDIPVTRELLDEFAGVSISLKEKRYTDPLLRDLKELKTKLAQGTEVILLGSVATDKYVGPLSEQFGPTLYYPASFRSLGDMARGAMLLRAVAAKKELPYELLERTTISKRGKKA